MLVLASTYKYKINARLSEYLTIFKNNFYSNHPPKKYIICTFFVFYRNISPFFMLQMFQVKMLCTIDLCLLDYLQLTASYTAA